MLLRSRVSSTYVEVDSSPFRIRLLKPNDAVRYRDIRLEALCSSPEAFGSTHEAESSRSLDAFAERLRDCSVFGAFRDAELIGMAGLLIRSGAKESHKGFLWGMYVQPASRKSGVGQQLVSALLDFARSRVELVQLSVVQSNEPARRLYARLGFVEYGIEKNSLKQDGQYYNEVLMAKDLKAD